ncbi:MAG: hypothetical protein HQK91_07235 [Nitrospirae bacterium]|nr:hypothetical protein [Nitrospirota bacterium]MBF0541228.1 hypothetical protein [Nitrospirota bacterium]
MKAIDLTKIFKRLKDLGINEKGFDDITGILSDAVSDNIASKSDVGATRADIEKVRLEVLSYIDRARTEIMVEIENLKMEMEKSSSTVPKWIILLFILQVGVAFVVYKYFPHFHL